MITIRTATTAPASAATTRPRSRVGMVAGAVALLSLAPPHVAVSARTSARGVGPTPAERLARDTDAEDAAAGDAPGDAKDARGANPTDATTGATYTIRSGDTLWNVSQSVMRDPRGWPKLWAMNPGISNPHWIYPGQVVRLRDGEGMVDDDSDDDDGRPRGNPAAGVSIGGEPRPLSMGSRPGLRSERARPDVVPLRALAFVDEGALKAGGTITGSIEEKIMLATGDQAYVEFPAGRTPQAGTRYSIYDLDQEHPLRSPGSTAILGYLAHVLGEVIVDGASERNIASGHLVNLSGPVERGYRVGPVIPQMRAVAPRPNKTQVTARIVAAVDPSSLIANQMFVILDRGQRHGVEPGNRFLVLRQGDGLKRIMESWDQTDPSFPPYAAAEIVAVDVGNETTVGWISRGSRELHVGDVADLRRGY